MTTEARRASLTIEPSVEELAMLFREIDTNGASDVHGTESTLNTTELKLLG